MNMQEKKKKNRKIDQQVEMPTTAEFEAELEHERRREQTRHTLRNTIFALLTAAAAAVLVATLIFPVFRIYGTSMTPTLTGGDVVMAVKTSKLKQGDLVAFYYNNKILVKRVIASSGQWVNIDADGNVSVNDQLLDEPYVSQKSLGDCDIDLPYQVPDGTVFVMGDHRDVSIDSRNKQIGPVSTDAVIGRLVLRVWPLKDFSIFK
jgi:signal peptidase I